MNLFLFATLNNQGTVVESATGATNVHIRNPAGINNTGSWTLSTDVAVSADSGAVVFNSTGTFVKSGGTAMRAAVPRLSLSPGWPRF